MYLPGFVGCSPMLRLSVDILIIPGSQDVQTEASIVRCL